MAAGAMLQKLLAEIESELLRQFPQAARAANVVEPVYALILCYIDTTQYIQDFMPYVLVVPERVRRRAFERKGAEASRRIWSPLSDLMDYARPMKQQDLEGAALQLMIRACYKTLTDTSGR